jgi:plastocyanin
MLGAFAAIAASIGVFGYYSSIPVNATSPVFGLPSNHFLKATYSQNNGYAYVSQSSGAAKGMKSSGGGIADPTYEFTKGNLQSIHFINEDNQSQSKHNFNIDAFNVHTRDLGYFESQTITFLTDKSGTFEYHCTLHPEMKGNIVIE